MFLVSSEFSGIIWYFLWILISPDFFWHQQQRFACASFFLASSGIAKFFLASSGTYRAVLSIVRRFEPASSSPNISLHRTVSVLLSQNSASFFLWCVLVPRASGVLLVYHLSRQVFLTSGLSLVLFSLLVTIQLLRYFFWVCLGRFSSFSLVSSGFSHWVYQF